MFSALSFVLGLLFGSFLNVCIERLPQHKSIVKPRSRCPHCGHLIRWYDNIPVVSYLLLRAKCRDCKQRISIRYPLVELATAVWFAFAASHDVDLYNAAHNTGQTFSFNDTLFILDYLATIIFGFLTIGLAVMDWRTKRLPDSFTFTGIFLGLLFTCMRAVFLTDGEDDVLLKHPVRINSAGAGHSMGNVFLTGPEHLIYGRLFAVVAAFLLLYLIRIVYKKIRHRDGMGLGDAKLLAMIAAFLGLQLTVLALFLGVLAATLYAIYLLATKQATNTTKLAFGTFLCLGGLAAQLLGAPIITWYTSLLR